MATRRPAARRGRRFSALLRWLSVGVLLPDAQLFDAQRAAAA
ncbi:hypothetical protein GCM10011490_25520 [Pseudoclavibacter endophyticus]|nr:hypothetical protein [Pseudoclavibacter endophyticus]GGA73549.1 hypothetical protein GCM10011490_25520 [Pseudoclavibacter endophyticus]